MMSKKTEFKKDFDRINKVFFLCKESYLVLRELYRTENNSDYLKNIKFKNQFFILTKVNYWRIIVLQISKLFFEKGPFNILRFLDKCKKGNYYSSLNVDAKFINDKLEFIVTKQYIFDDLKIQRDKIFAHEDSNNIGIVNNITLDEISQLLDFCKDVILHIYSEIYDTDLDFENRNSAEANLQYILQSLDENEIIRKQKREKNVFDLIRGNKNSNHK